MDRTSLPLAVINLSLRKQPLKNHQNFHEHKNIQLLEKFLENLHTEIVQTRKLFVPYF